MSPAYLAKVDGGDKTALPVGAGPFTVALPTQRRAEPRRQQDVLRWCAVPRRDEVRADPRGVLRHCRHSRRTAASAYIANPPVNKEITDKKIPNIAFLADVGAELLLNNRAGTPFADVRLRKAVAMAIDISLYNQRVNQGAGRRPTSCSRGFAGWFDPTMKPLAVRRRPGEAARRPGQGREGMGRHDPVRRQQRTGGGAHPGRDPGDARAHRLQAAGDQQPHHGAGDIRDRRQELRHGVVRCERVGPRSVPDPVPSAPDRLGQQLLRILQPGHGRGHRRPAHRAQCRCRKARSGASTTRGTPPSRS